MEDGDEEKVGILAAACEFPGVGVENGTDTLWETLSPPKPKFLYTRVPPSRWTNIARFEQAGRQTDAELLDVSVKTATLCVHEGCLVLIIFPVPDDH